MIPDPTDLDGVQTSTARRYRYFIDIVILIAAVLFYFTGPPHG